MTRNEAIDLLDNLIGMVEDNHCSDYDTALQMGIKALEPTNVIATGDGAYYKIKACEDAISRQALLDAFGFSEKTRKWGGDHSGYNTMMLYEIQDVIESAPSVKQEPKTGYWVKTPKAVMGEGYMWYCDKCGHQVYQDSSKPYPSENYCSNCGAKMVEPQEISDRNLKMWHDIFKAESEDKE